MNELAADHVTSCSKIDYSCVTRKPSPQPHRSAGLLNRRRVYSSVSLNSLHGRRIQLPQQVLTTVNQLHIGRHRGCRAGRRGWRRGLRSRQTFCPCVSNDLSYIPLIITQRTDTTSTRVVDPHRWRITLDQAQRSLIAVEIQRNQPDREGRGWWSRRVRAVYNPIDCLVSA